MFQAIKNALKSVWNYIKKIFVKAVGFLSNIVSFFKDPSRLKRVQENKNLVAVSIKENLENGNYNVVNCLFDKSENEIVDYQRDALIIEAQDLDQETKNQFKNKDMIVLQ